MADGGATYRGAGVDIDAGDEAVERIKDIVATTNNLPGVLSSIGGFGGLFQLDMERFTPPVLVAATDGVGTKLEVARLVDRYETVGIDLVAMCVDDLICVGAEPLFFLDYIAVGAVDPQRIEELVTGVAAGCRQAGCALLGGETAEHGGVMHLGDVDMAGFAVGVVERGRELGPDRVHDDDVLIGLASPGIRSNGYTLARHIFFERQSRALEAPAWDGASVSLADELLRPSVIYAPAILEVLRRCPEVVHAVAHITGGGLEGNLVRALPEGVLAMVDRSALPVPEIFNEIQRCGDVRDEEMARVFNLGVGMVLAVARGSETAVLEVLADEGIESAVVGALQPGDKGVEVQ